MAVKERIQEQVRIYTEYDAQRRAEEIAGSMLLNAVSKLEELTQNTVALMKSNDLLRKQLADQREATKRYLIAAIYYDETYTRLPEDMKKKFIEIGKGVIKDYDLPV
jgi:hypothetical protein